ncbi:MAG: L-threonylcarbamoyladenylate synthase [Microgenomates group bacterium]|nr:L-threonylcarbamoyladenylate synthase [Microgenomates group bacterium]
MKIINPKKLSLKELLSLVKGHLDKGGLVVFPSDTVYGLLVDATNEEAVKKLISFKERPPGKAISVFLSDFQMLNDYTKVNSYQLRLLKNLLPGPFTFILKSKHQVSKLLEAEDGTLGIRIPDYKLIIDLVKYYKKPLTATSANLSSQSPHYSIKSFIRSLSLKKIKLIDLIVDAGKLPRNKPSTVVDLTEPEIKILRQGGKKIDQGNKYFSQSPQQTKNLAKEILKKVVSEAKKKALVFILEGELGSGKTTFVKGIGEALLIKNIISPSFVVFYEYLVKQMGIKKLIHVDLFNLIKKEEFQSLKLDQYFQPGNLLIFEWGEKTGEIANLIKKKAKTIYIKIDYINKNKRQLIIKNKI